MCVHARGKRQVEREPREGRGGQAAVTSSKAGGAGRGGAAGAGNHSREVWRLREHTGGKAGVVARRPAGVLLKSPRGGEPERWQ